MNQTTYFKTATILSLCGTLFAGYLSGYKLLSGSCAFSEPCPYFLGYPACWYGFAMFLAMFLVSLSGLLKKASASALIKADATISFIGILFAGNFVVQEVASWWMVGRLKGYGLGLPTCVYGLVFYIAIFAISAAMLLQKRPTDAPRSPDQGSRM